MNAERTANFALRLGVAFAFLYPPVSALLNPFAWIGYFPSFLLDLPISEELLLHGFGVVEVIIGVWILFGKDVFYPCLIATAMLAAIVLFNLPQMDVVFRDISIALAALALAFMSRRQVIVS